LLFTGQFAGQPKEGIRKDGLIIEHCRMRSSQFLPYRDGFAIRVPSVVALTELDQEIAQIKVAPAQVVLELANVRVIPGQSYLEYDRTLVARFCRCRFS